MTAIRRKPGAQFIENRGRVRSTRIHQEHQRIGQRRMLTKMLAAILAANAGSRRSSPTAFIERPIRPFY